MDVLPYEMLTNIVKYCDDKSILNLGKVNTKFYDITKTKITQIKDQLIEYVVDKDKGVYNFIVRNDCYNFQLLLLLGLLKSNSSIFVTEDMMDTSLIDLCIRFKRFFMVKLLIEYGLDVNKLNIQGYSPLMKAVSQIDYDSHSYSYKIIVLLLENGADPNIESVCGSIPMDLINTNYGYFVIESIKELLREHGSREANIQYSMYDYFSDSDIWNF